MVALLLSFTYINHEEEQRTCDPYQTLVQSRHIVLDENSPLRSVQGLFAATVHEADNVIIDVYC